MNEGNPVHVLIFKSYLQTILNSTGSKVFRNLYALVNGKEQDILNDGELSCAYFVSHILLMFSLITEGHATVRGTVNDLMDSGWKVIDQPRTGAILVWEASVTDDEGQLHDHIGFYIGDDQAVSNSTTKRIPQEHFWTFAHEGKEDYRKVTAIFWNETLES